MNAVTHVHEDFQSTSKAGTTGQTLLAHLQIVAGVVCIGGGVFSSIVGSLLSAAGWIAGDTGVKEGLSRSGSGLLFLVIPLIIIGAFFLDSLEKSGVRGNASIANDEKKRR